jgi:hypothetical protein
MKNDKKKVRQEKLARIFFEMGMDSQIISKISGIEIEKIAKLNQKKKMK